MSCWWLGHYPVCVIAHFGPRATRQLLRCQTCRCLLQILLAAEGHTRLETSCAKTPAAHVWKKYNCPLGGVRHQNPSVPACSEETTVILQFNVAYAMCPMSQLLSWRGEVGPFSTRLGLMIRLSWLCKKQARLYCMNTQREFLFWMSPALHDRVNSSHAWEQHCRSGLEAVICHNGLDYVNNEQQSCTQATPICKQNNKRNWKCQQHVTIIKHKYILYRTGCGCNIIFWSG